ncbi:MAG: methyltransferase domain-containing protein [Bacillota bacterium]|nr:methyltransferase domain-containing protein [Bacillota bacterium]
MKLSVRLLLGLNRLFPRREHPFNLPGSYAEWQFEKARHTLEVFGDFASPEGIVAGKRLLDAGCGAGGKTVYFACAGAGRAVGVDLVERYLADARDFARRKGVADRTEFAAADVTRLPFPDRSFDVAVASDLMEHLAQPEAFLHEAARVLVPGGRLYVSFPPYGHPFGAHLSDAIGVPWVHLFCSEDTLGLTYAQLVKDLPDGEERLRLRFGTVPGHHPRAGPVRITYINHMSIRRFRGMLRGTLRVVHYRQLPLRPYLGLLAALAPEYFTHLVVCVLEK